MHILFIHPFLYRYKRGIETVVKSQSRVLAAKGYEVTVIAWDYREYRDEVLTAGGVRVITVPTCRYYNNLMVVPFYIWHLLRLQPDIIIIHWACYGERLALQPLLKSGLLRSKVVVVFHYPYQTVRHRYREFLAGNFWDDIADVIPISNFVAEGIAEFRQQQYTPIMNGVDTTTFQPRQRDRALVQSLGLKTTDRVLLTAAAFEERKGIQWVIRGLAEALTRVPDLKLVVLGEGPDRKVIEQVIEKTGTQDRVLLCGTTSEMPHFYSIADLFLLLSFGEACPMAPLEAMAMGLPVISSCHKPFDELVDDDVGRRVDERDGAAVADAIQELLKWGPDERQRIADLARQRHGWGTVMDKYLERFAQVLGQ